MYRHLYNTQLKMCHKNEKQNIQNTTTKEQKQFIPLSGETYHPLDFTSA